MTEKEKAVIKRTHDTFGQCIVPSQLKQDFQRLGIEPGMTILVHSSLSKIGWICGGSVTVIEVLLDLLGPEGTLMMPCFSSDNSDPKDWKNPAVPSEWFATIRDNTPAYQAILTPTYQMGKIVDTFRHWPNVHRSQHPQCSMLAFGKRASFLLDAHEDCFGERSPLARLYDCHWQGHVLLLGVTHGNNSSLHLAEYRFYSSIESTKVLMNGASILDPDTQKRRWIQWNDYDYDANDFDRLGQEFDAIPGNISLGYVGLAPCKLMNQYTLVDFAIEWMKKNR